MKLFLIYQKGIHKLGLKNFFTRSTTRAPATGVIVGRLYGNSIIPTGVLNGSNAMTNSDIYSVVNLIASEVAGMSFKSTPFVEGVLNRPNQITNQFNFWQSTMATMLLYGNAYVLINKNNSNQVSGFELLQDSQVTNFIVADDSSTLTYAVHFEDQRPDTYYDASEILHFKLVTVGQDQNDKYVGKSPLISLIPEIEIQNLSNALTKSSLKEGINPSVMLKTPTQLDKEAKNNIRDSFVDATTGENLGKPIVLDASAELQTLGIKSEVTSFLDNINWTKNQISKVYGLNSMAINGDGDAQSSLDMQMNQQRMAIAHYKNAITSELRLKLGVPVDLIEDITDDSLIARYSGLVSSQIISPVDANTALTQKGVI